MVLGYVVKMSADNCIRSPVEATGNESGEILPTFAGYFFEGNDWDYIVRVKRDMADERLKFITLGMGCQVYW